MVHKYIYKRSQSHNINNFTIMIMMVHHDIKSTYKLLGWAWRHSQVPCTLKIVPFRCICGMWITRELELSHIRSKWADIGPPEYLVQKYHFYVSKNYHSSGFLGFLRAGANIQSPGVGWSWIFHAFVGKPFFYYNIWISSIWWRYFEIVCSMIRNFCFKLFKSATK